MLEYLGFSRVMPTELFIMEATVADGVVSVKAESTRHPEASGEFTLDAPLSRAWLRALSAIPFGSWQPLYLDDEHSGEDWKIEIRETGAPDRLFAGSGAHPPEWEDFLRVVDWIVPVSTPMQIDSLCVRIERTLALNTPENAAHASLEELRIDRETDTLTLLRRVGDALETVQTFRTRAAASLLDACARLFRCPETLPPDAGSAPRYTLTIRRPGQPPQVQQGAYTRRSLPAHWDAFIAQVMRFLSAYATPGELFNPGLFSHGVRPGEYIYVSVLFPAGGNTYFYRTEDDSIVAGDFVLVPAGQENKHTVALVESVDYFTGDELPLPLEETKEVLGVIGKDLNMPTDIEF